MDFSEENVQAVITAIQKGMSRREAEKVFGAPKTTLGRRLKGPSNSFGQPPVLIAEEESYCGSHTGDVQFGGSRWMGLISHI